jgi:hypothetical protein
MPAEIVEEEVGAPTSRPPQELRVRLVRFLQPYCWWRLGAARRGQWVRLVTFRQVY